MSCICFQALSFTKGLKKPQAGVFELHRKYQPMLFSGLLSEILGLADRLLVVGRPFSQGLSFQIGKKTMLWGAVISPGSPD